MAGEMRDGLLKPLGLLQRVEREVGAEKAIEQVLILRGGETRLAGDQRVDGA